MTERSSAGTLVAITNATRLVKSTTERDEILDALTAPERPTLVAFVNADGCNLAVADPRLEQDLIGADVLLRDGSGMALLCRTLGVEPGLNMNGTDLIPLLLDRYTARPVALVGTRDPWLSAAAARVGAHSPVVLVRDGFSDEGGYVDELRATRADLIVLGMGMPRQERVGARLRRELEHPCTIVCGGAILDFLGGKVSRAPDVFRRLGIEWVWRLVCEPRRLFKRYIVGNVVFVARLLYARRLSVERRRAEGPGPA